MDCAFQYIDDSGGDVGYPVERSFELLEQVAGQELDESTRTAFLDYCRQEFDNGRYSGWDFGRRFMDLTIELAALPKEYDKIEDVLLKQFTRSKEKDDLDFIYSLNRERTPGLLLDLYKAAGRQQKVLRFMKENHFLKSK